MTPAILKLRLRAITHATLLAEGTTGGGPWHREGTGKVSVTLADDRTIEWHESGEWAEADATFGYHTRLRWVFDREEIHLEHLRRGADAPVHIASLVVNERGALIPRAPHLCGDDQYLADLRVDETGITLGWRATGPRKDYRLVTVYR